MPWDDEDLETGPLPKWFQIADRLRRAIEKGEFTEGDALPSEAVLGRRFGVSRTTARSALDDLENARLVARASGRGSIVLAPQVDQPLNLLSGFGDDMRSRGLRPGARTLFVRAARVTSEAAAGLGVDPATHTTCVQRLLLADGTAIAHSVVWLHPATLTAGQPTPGDLDDGSLYAWIERASGLRIASGSQFIEAEAAGEELARHLGLSPGDPVITARRTSRAEGGQVLEYVATRYRADRYRFRVELVRP
ncbi:GntR family transcriptional regulator [Streptomyces tremellae]|uniref:GntR family transcriptional regulator n=1 Tax=Streptomyces tremellae TaxID=1124239 RepID=A0ABP7FGP6_9ACTN